MILKYKVYVEPGINGFTIRVNNSDEFPVQEIGKIEDYTYILVDDEFDTTVLDERLEVELVDTLTSEEVEILQKQDFVNNKKLHVRRNIEIEVGDIHDLIADANKMIEFLMVLVSRMAGDYFGTHPFDESTKEAYAKRNSLFLDALDNKLVTIRGDYEDPDKLLQDLVSKFSKTNELVRDLYYTDVNKAQLI